MVYRTGPTPGSDAAQVHEGGADVEAVGDLAHAVGEHRVAGDPEHAVLLTVPAEGEADHVADDRAARGRAVAARRGRDLDGRLRRCLEPRGVPGCEPASVAAQSSVTVPFAL
jgi:hypothetical protein